MTSALLRLPRPPPLSATNTVYRSVTSIRCVLSSAAESPHRKGKLTVPAHTETTETTEPTEPDISPDKEAERRAVYSRCERFLGGHGPARPHAMLAALAAATDPDEQADRYGEGGLIEQFEREIVDLLGKEAAVFMPSGT